MTGNHLCGRRSCDGKEQVTDGIVRLAVCRGSHDPHLDPSRTSALEPMSRIAVTESSPNAIATTLHALGRTNWSLPSHDGIDEDELRQMTSNSEPGAVEARSEVWRRHHLRAVGRSRTRNVRL